MERKKFDKEYATSFKQEVEFLKTKGIDYVFVKNIDNISTYKYTKTLKLFQSLCEFYNN